MSFRHPNHPNYPHHGAMHPHPHLQMPTTGRRVQTAMSIPGAVHVNLSVLAKPSHQQPPSSPGPMSPAPTSPAVMSPPPMSPAPPMQNALMSPPPPMSPAPTLSVTHDSGPSTSTDISLPTMSGCPDGEAPPPYTTLPSSPRAMSPLPPRAPSPIPRAASPSQLSSRAQSPGDVGSSQWSGPGTASTGAGYAPSGVRLGYVDFVPRPVRKRMFKDDVYETFDVLLQRSNSWLEEHRGLQIVSCETVTWTGMRTRNIFSDSCSLCTSMNARRHTKYIRGLRIWYFVEVFPNPQAAHVRSPAIQCKTFVPRRNERFDQLVSRANNHLSTELIGGQIISIETVAMKYHDAEATYSPREVHPNVCFWKEYPDTNKKYVLCIRIFAYFGEDVDGYESLGYQDFVPEHNRRNQENQGYEVYQDLMQKASRWIARQQGVRFVSIQSLNIKLKKKGPFEERCIFTEHLCATNRSNIFKGPNRKTSYIRIVRIYFVVHQRVGSRREFPAVRLTYRTFSPAQITAHTTENPAEYEGMRQLMERVNQWLQITSAHVFHIETLPIRMSTGGLQLLGPEATFSCNTSNSRWSERWLYHIRMTLDGEYMEPPGAVSLVVPSAVLSRI